MKCTRSSSAPQRCAYLHHRGTAHWFLSGTCTSRRTTSESGEADPLRRTFRSSRCAQSRNSGSLSETTVADQVPEAEIQITGSCEPANASAFDLYQPVFLTGIQSYRLCEGNRAFVHDTLRQAEWRMANSEQWQVEIVATYLLEGRPSWSDPQ